MTNQEKESFGERNSRFWRNLHAGLGGLALIGSAVVVAPVAVAGLETFAAWEGLHAGFWEGARRHFAKKRAARA